MYNRTVTNTENAVRAVHSCNSWLFKIFIVAVLLVENDDNRKILFCRKNFPFEGNEVYIRRTADICVCRKRKLELFFTFRNAGNVKRT